MFKIDVLGCDQCGGRMRVLAFLTDPDVTGAILAHLGLPRTAPGIKPARAPSLLDAEGLNPEPFDAPSDHDWVYPLPAGDF